ncbi:MAG: division/cell wall cluster transcriptional repressor MraZ [Oscillospiraceae bacterium]|nr:division/cell wall cluster transcriptional repressor MraZ [Oscillospiraceae bacterium]
MLIGEFQHSLDTKGRVNFPSRLREGLGVRFYITKGLDGCLFVYSEDEWDALAQRIRALPVSKARDLQRFFFGGAAEAQPDKQGRVLIPANLREYAGLDKDIVIVGAMVRAEIWDKQAWEARLDGLSADAIAETIDSIEF